LADAGKPRGLAICPQGRILPHEKGARAMRFAGQQVVITGAAGVYGRGLAEAFAREGAQLLLTDGDAGALAALANVLPPGRVELHPADLTDDGALDGLIAAVTSKGAPQVLINNAGIYPFIPLMDVTGAEWDKILGVNTRAPFRLMQGIGHAMAAAGRGSIVNVTSAAADVHRGNGVPYGASKCALEYLTRAFALELGPSGVRVNSARPGFAEGSAGNPMPGGYAEAIRARSLMGALGTPADFAAGVMFLCSDDARFMPYRTLRDDGILEFDHRTIIRDARRTARQQLEDTPIALKFCKHEFTLTDLRWVYEAFVLDKVDPANFRRKVEQANDFVRASDSLITFGSEPGRPARLYTAGKTKYLNPPIRFRRKLRPR
jgi:3-oxoacyl-[acyl-carrier protein] reductase